MKTLLEHVVEIATNAHRGQFRRDGKTPYINHVAGVAKIVAEAGGGINAQCVAWLHDVIEDTPVTTGHLLKLGIPQHIVDDVIVLTHALDEPYNVYINRVLRSRIGDARMVKVANLLYNLTDDPTDKQVQKYTKALMALAKS